MSSPFDIKAVRFDAHIAQKVGVEEAIYLSNIEYWVERNAANNKHLFDGYYWTYNSREALTKLFPYWTERQLERISHNLIKHGLIKTGNHNAKKYDKTLWYTSVRPEFVAYLNAKISNDDRPKGDDRTHTSADNPDHERAGESEQQGGKESPQTNRGAENTPQKLTSPNGEMHFTKRGHASHQTGTPIPNHKPVGNKTVNRSNNPIEALPKLDQDEKEQRASATYILDGLGAKEQKSEKFFHLVASRIPRKIIETHLSGILYDEAKNPGALFTYRMTKYARERLEKREQNNHKATIHRLTKDLADSLKTTH